jgi:hypothetical protein
VGFFALVFVFSFFHDLDIPRTRRASRSAPRRVYVGKADGPTDGASFDFGFALALLYVVSLDLRFQSSPFFFLSLRVVSLPEFLRGGVFKYGGRARQGV